MKIVDCDVTFFCVFKIDVIYHSIIIPNCVKIY